MTEFTLPFNHNDGWPDERPEDDEKLDSATKKAIQTIKKSIRKELKALKRSISEQNLRNTAKNKQHEIYGKVGTSSKYAAAENMKKMQENKRSTSPTSSKDGIEAELHETQETIVEDKKERLPSMVNNSENIEDYEFIASDNPEGAIETTSRDFCNYLLKAWNEKWLDDMRKIRDSEQMRIMTLISQETRRLEKKLIEMREYQKTLLNKGSRIQVGKIRRPSRAPERKKVRFSATE